MCRLLLLLAMVMTGPTLAADNPPPAGKDQSGQGHDCHRPKPPETS